jgi:hypothetical protein
MFCVDLGSTTAVTGNGGGVLFVGPDNVDKASSLVDE